MYFFHRNKTVMDTMIALMEQYSNQLENIVAERTQELQVEKKKTEDLLYKMLPQYVCITVGEWAFKLH